MKIEELLAAKALILGYQIAKGKVFDQALELINKHISSARSNRTKPEVEAFYLMVIAEARRFRHQKNHSSDRGKIQRLCDDSSINGIFEIYIFLVEQSTQQHIVTGGGALSSLDKREASLGNDVMLDPDTGYSVILSDHRDVEKVLEWLGYGWGGKAISPSDHKFLYDVNLSDLIKKHFST